MIARTRGLAKAIPVHKLRELLRAMQPYDLVTVSGDNNLLILTPDEKRSVAYIDLASEEVVAFSAAPN
jgi:hypothetical protein